MVSTSLFQAFRWAESGTSVEQRENNKRAGIEKESNMSIAQWRLHFHCQRIRPTQLFDPQLIMYFFFILRLVICFFLVTWSFRLMTCYESSATHVFRIPVFLNNWECFSTVSDTTSQFRRQQSIEAQSFLQGRSPRVLLSTVPGWGRTNDTKSPI